MHPSTPQSFCTSCEALAISCTGKIPNPEKYTGPAYSSVADDIFKFWVKYSDSAWHHLHSYRL